MKWTTNHNYEEVQALSFPEIALISLNGGATPMPPLHEWLDVIEVRFDDVLPTGISPRYKGKKPNIAPNYVPMSRDHAAAIGDFIKKHWDKSIHVQCAAGVSRSAAVARVLHELGWHYSPPNIRAFGYKYANQHVVSLLRDEFPDYFGLIGQQRLDRT